MENICIHSQIKTNKLWHNKSAHQLWSKTYQKNNHVWWYLGLNLFFSGHRIMNWNEKKNLEWFNTLCKTSPSRSPNRETDYKFIIAKCTKNNSWNPDRNLKLVGADSISRCGMRNTNIIKFSICATRKTNLS